MNKKIWLVLTVSAVLLIVAGGIYTMRQSSPGELSLEEIMARLPAALDGWKTAGEVRYYDADTIFEYINGAGEVYRAYNLRQSAARRFEHPTGPEIVLDIFDMGTPTDAFGVFTHDLDGEPAHIGQDSRYRPGWLSFWKHRFFVSIYAMEETVASARVVRQLGQAVAEAIPAEGRRPEILGLLPGEGLQTDTVRYLHHHLILNYHYYLGDENLLNIEDDTPAVLATYRRPSGQARLLLVHYPSAERCRAAVRQWVDHYVPESTSATAVRLENGRWTAWQAAGARLAIVLEAETALAAEALLAEVPVN